jgi:hypothetical protein
MPPILVPLASVTPVVADQYRLYDVAPLTAVQESATCLVPPVAVTPLGAAGIVAAGVVAVVVAETSVERAPLRPLLAALTVTKYVVDGLSPVMTNGLVTFFTHFASAPSLSSSSPTWDLAA